MSITVIEVTPESRTGEVARDGRESRHELVYIASGTGIVDLALDAVDDVAPPTSQGLVKRRLAYEALSNNAYKVRVAYDSARRLLVNEYEYEFDIGTQSQNLTQSKGTTYYKVPSMGNVPFFGNAINVQDGRVNGVDVLLPTFSWSETFILPANVVTDAYKNTVYNLVGTKNASTFRLKAAGEVLFVGCRGRLRNEDEFSLQFSFVASPNVANLNVNGMFITKKGHDFVWFLYADQQDAGSQSVVKRPVFAYVEKVYEDGDFSLLGIGQ